MSRMLNSTLLLATLLTACSSLQPQSEQLAPELPEQWINQEGTPASHAGEHWWRLFNSPALNDLVNEALQHNHDIASAAARIVEAEANLGISTSNLDPVITLNSSAARRKLSTVTATPLFGGMPRYQNNARATLDASYQLDVWGKYRQANDAARAQLLATRAAQDTIKLTLTAEVVRQYFSWLTIGTQLTILRDQLQNRGDHLHLLKSRLSAGISSAYEVHQAEAEQAAIRSQLATALNAQQQIESTLALLLGRAPREIIDYNFKRDTLSPPIQTLWVPDGLPSKLLLQRPDILEAEQLLAAADARIAVARRELFPDIALTANFGSESATLGKLFSGPAGVFQFALGLSQPIFNGNRLKSSIKAAEARRQQAISAYQKAIANAFTDVKNALDAQTTARTVLEAESARINALIDAQRLANLRYQGGVSSHLDVLDADRQLLLAQLAKTDAENSQRLAIIELFKALGGGWSLPSAVVAGGN